MWFRDVLAPALPVVVGLVLVLGVGVFLLARRGVGPRNLMTAAEWRVTGQLVGIIVLGVVLVLAKIAMNYPAQQFIYGRF